MALSVLGSQTSVLDSVIGGQKLYLDGKVYTGAANEPKLSITAPYEAIPLAQAYGYESVINSKNIFFPDSLYQFIRCGEQLFVAIQYTVIQSSGGSTTNYTRINDANRFMTNENNYMWNNNQQSSSNYDVIRSKIASDDKALYFVVCSYDYSTLKSTILQKLNLDGTKESVVDLSSTKIASNLQSFNNPLWFQDGKLYLLNYSTRNVYMIDLSAKTVTQVQDAPTGYNIVLLHDNVAYGFFNTYCGKYENGAWTAIALQPSGGNMPLGNNDITQPHHLFTYNGKIRSIVGVVSPALSTVYTVRPQNNLACRTSIAEFDGQTFHVVDEIPYKTLLSTWGYSEGYDKKLNFPFWFIEGINHELYFYGNLYTLGALDAETNNYPNISLGYGLYELRRTATGIHITN